MSAAKSLLVVSHPAVVTVNQQPYAALRELGWDVRVIVPSRWRHAYSDGTFAPKRLEGFEPAIDPRPVALAGRHQRHVYLTRASSVLRSTRPSVLFLEEEPFSLAALQWGGAASRLGIPFGVQSDENLDRTLPFPVEMIRSRVLSKAAVVAARSPRAAELITTAGARGLVSVVPHHVAAFKAPRPEPRDGVFTVGYAGRLVPEKGVMDLVAAVQMMQHDARLLVVGSGPLEGELAGRPNVVLEAAVSHDEMAQAYQRMDVLVLPSRTTERWAEQFGRVLVEALQCGVPVIGSDSGEIPWVIETTGGGWVFPEGDAGQLACLLDKVAPDAAGRAERARAGAAVVASTFSLEAVVTALDGLLESARQVGVPDPSHP